MSLSYQHIYHAGNQADIHKHLWLVATLNYLKKKEKPFYWLDTHSGRGLYDLASPEAMKTAEYRDGLFRLENASCNHTAWDLYKSMIAEVNGKDSFTGKAQKYPGSSVLTAMMLRDSDRMTSCELHPGEFAHLKRALRPFSNAKAKKTDMRHELFAALPPDERRGGVLIDPSYELKDEYDTIAEDVLKAHRKWATGIYMIWYPMLPSGRHETLKAHFKDFDGDIIIDEWIYGHDQQRSDERKRGMYGSGMIVINPQYTVPETLDSLKAKILPLFKSR